MLQSAKSASAAAEALYRAVRTNLETDEASRRALLDAPSVPKIAQALTASDADFGVAASKRGKKLEVLVVARNGELVYSGRLPAKDRGPALDKVARALLAAVRGHQAVEEQSERVEADAAHTAPSPSWRALGAPRDSAATATAPVALLVPEREQMPAALEAVVLEEPEGRSRARRLRLEIGAGASAFTDRISSRRQGSSAKLTGPATPELALGAELDLAPLLLRLEGSRQTTMAREASGSSPDTTLTRYDASLLVAVGARWASFVVGASYASTAAAPAGALTPGGDELAAVAGATLSTGELLPAGLVLFVDLLAVPWARREKMPLATRSPGPAWGGRARARLRWARHEVVYLEASGGAETLRTTYQGTAPDSDGGHLLPTDRITSERRSWSGGIGVGFAL